MTEFRAAIAALAAASNATDVFAIFGGSKPVAVRRIRVSGTATAATGLDLQLVKRSTADSAGTSSTLTAVGQDSNDATAATATLKAYTANPTLGTAVGAIAARKLALVAPGTAVPEIVIDVAELGVKPFILNGAAECLCLNLGGSAPAGASLNVEVEWTEA